MRNFVIISMLLLISFNSFSAVKRICKVKYQTEDGWSKEYTMEVEFITGSELNEATHTYKYQSYSKYCCIWFSDGGVAIVEITDYISISGQTFEDEDFKNAFPYNREFIIYPIYRTGNLYC